MFIIMEAEIEGDCPYFSHRKMKLLNASYDH